ncbi:hypothetical protein SUGI_1034450 [Cryptomeria japonica]|nr:hypothetical protein SUGI_1034450 [Cryptomeria japonica]
MFGSSSCLMDHPGFLSESCSFSKYKYRFSRRASFKKCLGLKSRERSAAELSRRAFSESNLMLPLIRNEETNQRIGACHFCRVMWSWKNGLLVAADHSRVEFKRMVMMNSPNQESHHENWTPFGEVQSERDMIHHPEKSLEVDKKQVTHNFYDSGDSGSMSENSVMAENWLGLKVGLNGMALFCTERGCAPAHVCEIEHRNEGSDFQDCRGEDESSRTESSSTDLYYQMMLEANPDNPLLLRNYAKFLHEVQHDMKRAEQYFCRAILASPGDGEIMSLYAKFIWESHKDPARAETYFERAVKAAPEDCYVIASYANFLWTCEEDEEENGITTE